MFGLVPSAKPQIDRNMAAVMDKAKTFTTYQSPSKVKFVSFVDDDGYSQALDNLYPIFAAKSAPCNLAIITGTVGNAGRLTVNNLKTLMGAGWELLGHGDTYVNNYTEFATEALLENDLRTCRNFLQSIGSYKTGFVYPQSAYNTMIRRSVLKFFDYSFADIGFGQSDPFVRPLDASRVKRIAFGYNWENNPTVNAVVAANTLAYYEACVDWAVTANAWLVFMVHSWSGDTNLTILADLIDYIQAAGVTIGTTSEGYEIHGPRLFMGDIDGQFFSINEDAVNVTKDNDILLANAITVYRLHTISVSYVGGTQAASEGWPESTAGVLITNRVSQYWYWNWQEYQVYGSNRVYLRCPTSDSAWGAWMVRANGTKGAANADTALTFTGSDTVSKADIVTLQTEVNQLKATLRAFNMIAT